MTSQEMAHRWCNLDFGKNDRGYGGRSMNTRCDDTCFYSYSTVYAMWWDKNPKSKVMILLDYDYAASVTSRKHLGELQSAITPDTFVVETHKNAGYYSCGNVDFRHYGIYTLLKNLLDNAHNKALTLKDSKELHGYKDICSKVHQYIKSIKHLYKNKYFTKKGAKENLSKTHFKFLNVCISSTESQVIHSVVGQAELDAYDKRVLSLKKAQETRCLVDKINAHYRLNLTAKELRKILKTGKGIKECVTQSCMPVPEKWTERNWGWRFAQEDKIRKYITGSTSENPTSVVNRFNGDKYDLPNDWNDYRIDFDLRWDIRNALNLYAPSLKIQDYKNADDKKAFMVRFYKKCKIYDAKSKAVIEYFKSPKHVLNRVKDLGYWKDVLDSANSQSDYDTKSVDWVDMKLREYRANIELQKQREAEEKARLEAEKKRVLQSYLDMGVDGYRKLWIDKYESILQASNRAINISEFYYGGNVLLRWRDDTTVETSKSIKITITQAEKIWKTISEWHNNPETFKPIELHTSSGDYKVVSYQNDILTAGCHSVAYCEMERMWKEIEAKRVG